MAILQDKKGFLWIATLDGLQRYDGRRFLIFRNIPGNLSTIPNDQVHDLMFDKKDRLWLKCSENRIGYFNTKDFSFHEVAVRFPGNKVRTAESRFFKDSHGNLMLLMLGAGVFTYDESLDVFSAGYNPFRVPERWLPVTVRHNDFHNNYWIACDSGLVKYDPLSQKMSYRGHNAEGDKIIETYSNLRYVGNPYIDRTGRFWLYCWPPHGGGPFLYSYNIRTGEKKEWEKQISMTVKNTYHELDKIVETKDGNLWVTGGNLLASLNENTQLFEAVPGNLGGEFSIRYDAVRQLFEDRERNLWACTNKGLFRFNPSEQFCQVVINRRYDKDTSYNADVSAILQTRKGEILATTWGNAVFAYDNNFHPVKSEVVNQSLKLSEALTWCIHERVNGDIWKGNQDGFLFIYHAGTNKTERLQLPVFGKSTIRQIAEDKEGNLWLGTHSGLLVKWDSVKNSFSLIQKLNSVIERIYADRNKNIWVCTRSAGVYMMNSSTNGVAYHLKPDGPEGRKMYKPYAVDMMQYSDSLYMIASGCINVFNIKQNSIRHLTSDQGYPANIVNNIIKDRNGYIWVTSMSGLCSINFEKDVVTTYNERDGVHTNAFSPGTARELNDGRIAIGTPHDLLVFDPSYISGTAVGLIPPDITITAFVLMNKRLRMDSLISLKTIELDHDKTSISIEFSTLTYLNSYGIFYKMDGLDKEWKISSAASQAIYNSLPPGEYTFKAFCKNGNGMPSRNITEIKIKVNPAFWQTWWFYSLVIILIGALIFWYDRERMNRKESMQAMRSEIAGNLHQEVNMALNNINVLSEMARIKADTDPEKSKEFIEQIQSRSHNMIIAMDDMLWSISPANDGMQKTVDRMREFIDSLKNRYGVDIRIAVDKKVESFELNMKLRHEAFLLFKEGIKSLVMAGTKKCEIQIGLEKNELRFTMQFDNAGCDIQQLNHLLHRQDMEKRMQSINAAFDVQVHKSHSIFILQVPV